MATEVNEAGYQDLRDYVMDNWSYIEFRDDMGEVVQVDNKDRLLIGTDLNFAWTTANTDQELKVEGTIAGSNVLNGAEVTIAESALYKVDTAGDELHSDTDTAFVFGDNDDELQVTHSIELPQLTQ